MGGGGRNKPRLDHYSYSERELSRQTDSIVQEKITTISDKEEREKMFEHSEHIVLNGQYVRGGEAGANVSYAWQEWTK